jgi:hypothetical protein
MAGPEEAEKDPPVLDYATSDTERNEWRSEEDEEEARRLRALRNYNESTFGEAYPFRIWPHVVVICVACAVVLPASRWLSGVLGVSKNTADILCMALCLVPGVVWVNWAHIRDAVLHWMEGRRK